MKGLGKTLQSRYMFGQAEARLAANASTIPLIIGRGFEDCPYEYA